MYGVKNKIHCFETADLTLQNKLQIDTKKQG